MFGNNIFSEGNFIKTKKKEMNWNNKKNSQKITQI